MTRATLLGAMVLCFIVGCGDGSHGSKDPIPTPQSTATSPMPAVTATAAANTWAIGSARPDAGGESVIVRSADRGVTWERALASAKTLRGIEFVDSASGWAVGTEEILRSTDGGRTWISQRDNAAVASLRLEAIVFLNESAGVAIGAEAPQQPGALSGPPLMLRTEDMGSHWTRAPVAGTTDAQQDSLLRGACFTSSAIGVAVGFGLTGPFVARSVDAGLHWSEITPHVLGGLVNTNPTAVSCAGVGDIWMVGQGLVLVAHSPDAGVTWVDQSETASDVSELFDIAFVDATTGWAAGTDKDNEAVILHTVNGGTAWSAQALPDTVNSTVLALRFGTPTDGVAVGSQGQSLHPLILTTSDGGQRWKANDISDLLLDLSEISTVP